MALSSRIVDLIYTFVTGNRSNRRLLAPLGLTIFTLSILLVIAAAIYLDYLLQLPKLLSRPLSLIISVPLMGIGAIIAMWSILSFLRARGTPVPLSPPPMLVTTGPYGYVRNPMVSGLILEILGIGFWFRSISMVFILTPILILLAIFELKNIEEPELEKRLGQTYIEYKKKTPMFFPKLRIRTRQSE